jgi:hypothetical protein
MMDTLSGISAGSLTDLKTMNSPRPSIFVSVEIFIGGSMGNSPFAVPFADQRLEHLHRRSPFPGRSGSNNKTFRALGALDKLSVIVLPLLLADGMQLTPPFRPQTVLTETVFRMGTDGDKSLQTWRFESEVGVAARLTCCVSKARTQE